MQEFVGKTAFVTGGASGIGLALGRAFAEAGAKVMLADIDEAALAAAVDSLRVGGAEIRGVVCDVADPVSVERAAEASSEAFGKIHVLCNNAGVSAGRDIDDIAPEDWRWVLDVNLMGVIHGLRAFLPRLRAHGEGGHILNTASIAGILRPQGLGPYPASKYAVVAISEGLATQLKPLGIGVTVLCPGFVNTRIIDSARNRPERYGPAWTPDPDGPVGAAVAIITARVRSGLEPARAAASALAAIRADELYAFTDASWRAHAEQRFSAILAAMDRVAAG
jgi:NAD(P)-dependent dehydrogenase (short-subunit alcohol dehydrogenase family)